MESSNAVQVSQVAGESVTASHSLQGASSTTMSGLAESGETASQGPLQQEAPSDLSQTAASFSPAPAEVCPPQASSACWSDENRGNPVPAAQRPPTISRANEGRGNTTGNSETSVFTGDTTEPLNRPARSVAVVTKESNPRNKGNHGSPAHSPPSQQAALDLSRASHPTYTTVASRRKTFSQSWDGNSAPPLQQIIVSGFFYAGYADCVRCFYCGVELRSWQPTDDVWTLHVRWRHTCGLLRAVKGVNFIQQTLERLKNEAVERRGDGLPAGRGGNPQETALNVRWQQVTVANAAPPTEAVAASSAHCPHPTLTLTAPAEASYQERCAELQAENQNLRQRLQCKVCGKAPVNVTLLPCGHLILCSSCEDTLKSCPLCRKIILATVTTFFS